MFNSAPELRSVLRSERIWLVLAIGAINALGFFMLLALVVPQQLALQTGGVFGVGLGLTAYVLGMRHAFDADHIATIDNTTRKLLSDGKRTDTVGFFFSLGHSTIVVVLGAIVAFGAKGVAGALENPDSALNQITGTWGPTVAGLFLLLIGALNLGVLLNMGRAVKRLRRGDFDEAVLERQLQSRGAINRLYSRASKSITAPWQMYPLGVMFGLGFDTASEIALLLLAGGAAAGGLPFYAVMCLPILFAAGMTLFDTLNSVFMNQAYGWAFENPVRKVFYNFTMTVVSVISAFVIGTLSLLGVFWDSAAAVNLDQAGYALVAMFALIWLTAIATWKFGDIERRWSHSLEN
jgi:high-affinity nickel-transport protein